MENLERKAKQKERKFTRTEAEKNIKFTKDVRKAYSTDMKKV